MSPKCRTSISPSAVALVSTTTSSSSSKGAAEINSPTSPAESTSSSPYLLPELIPLVASCLTSLQDFFALRAACRTYRALLPPSPSNLASQAPLLLVPRNGASASEDLSHAPLRRLLRLFLPRNDQPRCHTYLSSFFSFSCRAAIHDRNFGGTTPPIRHILHIRHLLTGEQARLPDPMDDFHGLAMSSDLVLTFTKYHSFLYYCRIGDAHWRAASCHQGYVFHSLMFLKDTLYALVFPNCYLAAVELRNNTAKFSFLGEGLSTLIGHDCTMLWLAECGGELLVVVAVQRSPRVYHVFRWQSADRKWARTTSLGGCSLFFNKHQFAGCLDSDHPTVRKDCLYFAGYSGKWSEYSLVDGSTHKHVADEAKDYYQALAWVLPSIS